MAYLHGFRRIEYDFYPLADAVLRVAGVGDNKTRNPEDEARRWNDLVNLLEQESNTDVFQSGISYSLYKIAEEGLVGAAKILIQFGASIDFEDPVSYYNPLHIAVLKNKPEMVKLLVEHGADIEKRDRIHQSSPLDLASEESDRLPCLFTLLDLGAKVNAKNKYGKTSLLHAIASTDGLAVQNQDTIKFLIDRGADVHAITMDGESVITSLVSLVREALAASRKDAVEIGKFCIRVTRLLLGQGVNPSSCLNDLGEPCLMQTSLEHFDLLYPLAVLLIQSGASLVCSLHGDSCWSGYVLILNRLQTALKLSSNQCCASELFEKAEVLLDLARVNVPSLHQLFKLELPNQDDEPYVKNIVDLHKQIVKREASVPSLSCICRAVIRSLLKPWPMHLRVNALPLPEKLKDFLLPERNFTLKPGWDCCKPSM